MFKSLIREGFNGSYTTLGQHSALEIAAGASKDKEAIFHLPGPVFLPVQWINSNLSPQGFASIDLHFSHQ